MADNLAVKQNQSTLDVILQGCGALEAGMQMMRVNGRSISDYPDVGDNFEINDKANSVQNDPATLQYLQQNNIVIGTAGKTNEPIPTSATVILKPVLKAVPTISTPPSSTVNYEVDLTAAAGFINVYNIPHEHYPANDNKMWYQTEDEMLEGDTPAYALCSDRYMDDKILHYSLGWSVGRGLTLIWNDLTAPMISATFVDEKGNQAYYAPLIILDNITQTVEECMVADIKVEFVSAGPGVAIVRLTRSHSSISHFDFVTHEMTWTHDAVGGVPDPADPSNPDKTILTLPAGKYTFGVTTVYINDTYRYPPSAFTEVVEIA